MNKRRRNRAKEDSTTTVAPAGWRINKWCEQIGCCRSQFYNLRDRGGIDVVTLGGMVVVRTDPRDYLAAKAAEQATVTAPVSRPRGRPRSAAPREDAPAHAAARPDDGST